MKVYPGDLFKGRDTCFIIYCNFINMNYSLIGCGDYKLLSINSTIDVYIHNYERIV